LVKRYFSDKKFVRLQNDFEFLIKIIKSFKGELEFSIRDNYFNLYSRGNSAAKVSFLTNGTYRIEINKKFYPPSLKKDKRFSATPSGDYQVIKTTKEHLHSLLQKKSLEEIYSKIKNENYSEEFVLEQMLITDNLNRDDLILIDRQVTDPNTRKKLDLLALKQVQGNQYQFLVLEVKMGNNPELKDKVANQLNNYVNHITEHFKEYKSCYEKNYSQKKIWGLFENPNWDAIEIVPNVQGMIIVGGYSGLAKEQIEVLKKNYPTIKVQSFYYKVNG